MKYLINGIYFVPVLISVLQLVLRKNKFTGSDHYYHIYLINLIRLNKHRPVSTHANMVNSNIIGYPQLLHCALSFASDRFVLEFSKWMPSLANFLMAVVCVFFNQWLVDNNVISCDTKNQLLTAAGFCLIPYTFNSKNSKNTGLSARGLGLTFGFVFVCLLMMYEKTGSLKWMGFASFIAFLIYFSSQFATQFILFVTPLLCVFYLSPLMLVPLALGFVIFLLFFSRTALSSVKGQYGHKKVYAKFLAQKFILRARPSVWLDFILVFPRSFYSMLLKSKNLFRALGEFFSNPYFRNNSIVLLLLEMPLMLPVIIGAAVFFSKDTTYISGPVYCTFVVFLFVTLKPLRFLGEPERYLEFVFFIAAVLAPLVLPFWGVCVMVSYQFIVVLGMLYKSFKTENKQTSENIHSVESVKEFLLAKSENEKVSMLCNSTDSSKFLFDHRYSFFYYLVTSEKNDEFHFTDVYDEDYSKVKDEILPAIMNRYKLNYLVLDERFPVSKFSLFKESGIQLKEVFMSGKFTVYTV